MWQYIGDKINITSIKNDRNIDYINGQINILSSFVLTSLLNVLQTN